MLAQMVCEVALCWIKACCSKEPFLVVMRAHPEKEILFSMCTNWYGNIKERNCRWKARSGNNGGHVHTALYMDVVCCYVPQINQRWVQWVEPGCKSENEKNEIKVRKRMKLESQGYPDLPLVQELTHGLTQDPSILHLFHKLQVIDVGDFGV